MTSETAGAPVGGGISEQTAAPGRLEDAGRAAAPAQPGGSAAAPGPSDAQPPAYDPAVKSAGGRGLALACFKRIVEEIHTTVVATVDDNGRPVTCVIDMMGYDEGGLYFVTNVGKAFYRRLKERGYLSLSATNGKPTMECVAVTLSGQVSERPVEELDRLLRANPYMYELYPTPEKRAALRPFKVHGGSGNLYDLSAKPPAQTYFEF